MHDLTSARSKSSHFGWPGLWVCTIGLTVTGCGGSTSKNGVDADGGSGGTTSTGMGTNSSGSGGSQGTTTDAATTDGGVNGVTSGTSTSTTGGSHCSMVECEPPPPCDGGTLVVPDGECCLTCACTGAECAPPECEDGSEPILDAGSCCPRCPEASCSGAECQPAHECPEGYSYGHPAGACCSDCVPNPGQVACLEPACPPPNCPPGYATADTQGGCCYDCVPDPRYCNSDTDCVIADHPRSCCGCPEAVSLRVLDDDPCWFATSAPKELPQSCYPDSFCDALCGACAEPGEAKCVDHRCSEVRPSD